MKIEITTKERRWLIQLLRGQITVEADTLLLKLGGYDKPRRRRKPLNIK